jgi:hypothetical protein
MASHRVSRVNGVFSCWPAAPPLFHNCRGWVEATLLTLLTLCEMDRLPGPMDAKRRGAARAPRRFVIHRIPYRFAGTTGWPGGSRICSSARGWSARRRRKAA